MGRFDSFRKEGQNGSRYWEILRIAIRGFMIKKFLGFRVKDQAEEQKINAKMQEQHERKD
ncbi:hypothetical protein [Paenibacillus pinihumi]|uniref:hypothetical protein n=1 Tax=Paenibacillus pinihumi TaxID=669462 RepID=UPI0004056F8C|nr:hypothetical protein [Paenibacillus pinihumi]